LSAGTRQSAPRRIALVWEQFAPYHVDRCEAVARRLEGRATVTCIELASGSRRYAWPKSGEIDGADKLVLFAEADAEDISRLQRLRALLAALEDHDLVILGLSSSDPVNALLARRLRRRRAQVFFCSDSKLDDYPRRAATEWLKRFLLRSYDGGIVAGSRSHVYYLGLGVAAECLWPGYDTVSNARLRRLVDRDDTMDFADRPFLFLGRFVPKKALHLLLEAYAHYRAQAPNPRGLVLAGSGPLEEALRAQAKGLGVDASIRWTGFLGAQESVREMSRAVALMLPSLEEQWGLVVNEAVALGLPVIASAQVGATDLLVRDAHNGYVVPTGDPNVLAEAMVRMGSDETRWLSMREACADLAWFGDSDRFADTVEDIAFSGSPQCEAHIERLRAAWTPWPDRTISQRPGTIGH
jgi:glycosyltransferase involved in cell wall biosynthesis